MKSSSVSEYCCKKVTGEEYCPCSECANIPPQSDKSDSGIAWALKELGWNEPEYGWTHEKEVLNKLIAEAEQRGYERGKRELEPKYGGQG